MVYLLLLPRMEAHPLGCHLVDIAYSICSVSPSFLGKLTDILTLARLFFNILHPPLNVPALGRSGSGISFAGLNSVLAVSLDTDVDTNKELVAHGYSNLLSGLFGTV